MASLGLRLGGQVASRFMTKTAQFPTTHMATRRWFSEMPLTFATPNNMFYSGSVVKQIDVPSMSGSFGILPSHVPTMAALAPGVVTVYEADGSTTKYFVSSGTVTVNGDSTVQLLAEEACLVSDIDVNAAREAVASANATLAAAKDEVERAEAQIAADAADAIIKAVS